MRGLLRNDIYILARSLYMMLIAWGICLAASLITGKLALNFFGCILTGLMPVNLLSVDERDGWQSCCMTMPVSRRVYVGEKYLFGLMCVIFGIAVTALAALAAGFGAEDVLAASLVMLMLGLTPPALSLPFILRLGTAKGQVLYLIVCGAAWGVACVILNGGTSPSLSMPAGILALTAVIVYVLSWLISVRLFETREL